MEAMLEVALSTAVLHLYQACLMWSTISPGADGLHREQVRLSCPTRTSANPHGHHRRRALTSTHPCAPAVHVDPRRYDWPHSPTHPHHPSHDHCSSGRATPVTCPIGPCPTLPAACCPLLPLRSSLVPPATHPLAPIHPPLVAFPHSVRHSSCLLPAYRLLAPLRLMLVPPPARRSPCPPLATPGTPLVQDHQ